MDDLYDDRNTKAVFEPINPIATLQIYLTVGFNNGITSQKSIGRMDEGVYASHIKVGRPNLTLRMLPLANY